MEQPIPLIIMILVLLLASRLCGELAERVGQLAMIGEIVAGIILGPSVLGVVKPSEQLKVLSELGVFMLVLLGGIVLDFRDIAHAFRGRGSLTAVMAFVVPFSTGMLIARLFGFDATAMVFLGLCMSLTALSTGVRILMDLNRLQTSVAQRIVTAAVQDDVTSLVLLGIILAVKDKGELVGPVLIGSVKTLAFLATVIAAYWLVSYTRGHIPHSRKAVAWAERNLRGKEPLFALTLLFVLGFASLAESIGLHFVVGAFFGSMILSRKVLGKTNYANVEKMAARMGLGFLAPIFFASIGMKFQLAALSNPLLIVSVLAAAFLTKVLGGYVGARMAGVKSSESWAVAWGLNGRGTMELIIADLALKKGYIGPDLFAALVLMGMVTTMLTPGMLKWAFRRADAAAEREGSAPAVDETASEFVRDLAEHSEWAVHASGTERELRPREAENRTAQPEFGDRRLA